MISYKYLPNHESLEVKQILRIDGDMVMTINLEVDSTYKEEYEAWLAEDNEPLPTDNP